MNDDPIRVICGRCQHPRLDHAPAGTGGARGACLLTDCTCSDYRSAHIRLTGLNA